MATRFMLDPEQPKNNANWPNSKTTGKDETKQSQPEGTFHSLFGPPSPTLSRAEKARLNARKPSNCKIKPSKKPLPGTKTLHTLLSLSSSLILSKPLDW